MLRKYPLYPTLFVVFCVLSLTAYNIGQIYIGEALRPLVFSLLLAMTIHGLSHRLLRDSHRAAAISTVLLLLFYTYGQIYAAFEGRVVLGLNLFRHRILFPAFILTGIFAVLWVLRKVSRPELPTYWLNLVSIFLLIYPSMTIASHLARQLISDSSAKTTKASNQKVDGNSPDLYYIILDGYGRQDILQREYGFDNNEFIKGLRARGFYVAECSQSNYAHTLYSLTSSLNFDFLDSIGVTDDSKRIALLKHGAVRAAFESHGYEIVAFPTGWSMTEWTDANIYPSYGKSFTTLTEFETLFLDTTMLRVATDYDRLNSKTTQYSAARRLRIYSELETLKQLPSRQGKYFVLAHFVIPHPPFSFGANGEWLEINMNTATQKEIENAYINQVIYINREITKVIDVILKESKTPPVIIVQGDHGPPPDLTNDPIVRMPILNAYYLPGANEEEVLYPSISPVNSFRVVLNQYFGTNLPLLKDESFFAPNHNHARLGLVPNSCP